MRGVGIFLLATIVVLAGAEATAQSKQQAAPCRGQLHFQKPTSEGVSSVQLLFHLELKNTGNHPCVARHFLIVEVPRNTGAPIDVQPRVGGDLAPAVSLTRSLTVEPGKSVVTVALLDTPCGSIVGTTVHSKIVFVADEWPVRPKTSIDLSICRTEANEIEVWPLAHP